MLKKTTNEKHQKQNSKILSYIGHEDKGNTLHIKKCKASWVLDTLEQAGWAGCDSLCEQA